MRRLDVKEYLERIRGLDLEQVAMNKRHRQEQEALNQRYALLEINYNGPNWLTTGKVGGWDE